MKIAVVHNLPAGGQKRLLYEQVKRLSKNHQLDVYTPSSSNDVFAPLKSFAHKYSVYSYQVPLHFPMSVISIYTKLHRVYKEMAEDIRKGRYDLVYVQPDFLTQAPYILRELDLPIAYYCSEPKREFYEPIPRYKNSLTYSLTYPFRLPIKSIDCTNISHSTVVITISQFARKNLKNAYGIDSEVNYPGVDTQKFSVGASNKQNAVLSVGDFTLLKGQDFIIQSLSLIPEKIRPKLILVGNEGIDKEFYIKFAQKKDVKLEIYEKVSDEKLVKLYQICKVFVYAALREPFGLVLLEAASCGLPIVAVKEGGISEIVSDSLLGMLTARNDRSFSNAICDTLKHASTNALKRHTFIESKWSWNKSIFDLELKLKKIAR